MGVLNSGGGASRVSVSLPEAVLSAAGVLLIWSGSGVFSHLATSGWNALQAAWWESLCGSLVALLFLPATGLLKQVTALQPGDFLRLTALGLLAHTGYYSFLFIGFASGYQVQTMALNYTWAVFMVVFGGLINRAVPKWYQWVSVGLGVLGAILVVIPGSHGAVDGTPGALAGLGAGLCFGLFTPLSVRWSYDPRLVTSWMLFLSTLVFSLVMLLSGTPLSFRAHGMIGALYMGIGVDFVGYALWQRANRRLHPWVVSVWACLIPLLNITLLTLVAGLRVPPPVYLGGSLIVAALVVQNVFAFATRQTEPRGS